jgi:hypothetical protein
MTRLHTRIARLETRHGGHRPEIDRIDLVGVQRMPDGLLAESAGHDLAPEPALMTEPRNNAQNTRGRPFQPGNPGRPKGARNRAIAALETLMGNSAEDVAQAVIKAAMPATPPQRAWCWSA